MYPFKAILVGEETIVPPARQRLGAHAVEVEAVFPDAGATIAWLSQAPEARRLFVVHVAGPEQLEAVKELRARCVGQPILALAPAAGSDKETLLHLMRAGVDQAVFLPLQPGEFGNALDSLAWQFGCPVSSSPVIAVAGVTPGSGVSTLAINLAYEIAARRHKCILVEGTHRLGKLAGQLGVTPRFTTRELMAAGDRLDVHMVDQALVPVAEGLRLLAAAADEVQPLEVGRERFREVFGLFRQVAEVTLLRVSYNVGSSYFAALEAVDQVFLVAQHTPGSLHDLKLMCQALRREHGVHTLYPVINRYDRRNRELALTEIQEALEEPKVLTVGLDRYLARAGDQLLVLRQQSFGGPTLRDIQAIARLVLQEPEPVKSGGNRFWQWLKRLFSGG